MEIGLIARRRIPAVAVCALLASLYLANLSRMGLVGPDEPRYADVGRAMAATGDWVTPRLWGQPWFEKPALLYWMTAAGFKLGLSADLAPRLPVALLSLGFLAFLWFRVKAEWGAETAVYATAILATSAGWLTYSEIAVADLPLAVFFSAAVLLSLPWIGRGETRGLTLAAGCLGVATLAKGLVPLVLFLPVVALRPRRIGDWLRAGPLAAFAVTALPWYALCTLRNGPEFLKVFFVEHHFQRFTASDLQHVQPWWFYLPILLALLFPWFPLLTGVGPVRLREDARLRALAAVVAFGVVFFSAAVNKLPGYLLPLLPAACILMGAGLAQRQGRAGGGLVASMGFAALLPVAARVAPEALAHGLRSANVPWISAGLFLVCGLLMGAILTQVRAPRGVVAQAAFVLVGLGFVWFEFTTFPRFNLAASARPLWAATHPTCVPQGQPGVPRAMLYGLYYYSGRALPECEVLDPAKPPVVR